MAWIDKLDLVKSEKEETLIEFKKSKVARVKDAEITEEGLRFTLNTLDGELVYMTKDKEEWKDEKAVEKALALKGELINIFTDRSPICPKAKLKPQRFGGSGCAKPGQIPSIRA